MDAIRLTLYLIVCLMAAGCGRSNDSSTTAAAGPPQSTAGVTDPAYDWERPERLNVGPREPLPVNFKSTKPLEATTRWLQWALQKHGHAKPTIYQLDIDRVAFSGCAMEMTITEKPSDGVTKISNYSAPLGDIDLSFQRVRYSSHDIDLQFKRELTVNRRYIEDGRDKGSRTEMEWTLSVPIQGPEQLPVRVGLALIHAARLCGAKP